MILENNLQRKNKQSNRIVELSEKVNEHEKTTSFITIAETKEIAERMLSVFAWNGH